VIIERKVSRLGGQVTRASLFLNRNLASAISVERSLEKKSLDLKKKIVEARGRTLRTIGSRDKDSQTTGGIGGALGLLGLGFTRRLFRPRVPKTPGSLLRLQRGASVSRAGQLGRVGRLARPLAIVGTGLDFIGRRAEGQTNVQAGVGAAGGLAGSLAGAKYGAILGTAVAGPIGTAIGGVGGAIIGGLAGGRIADLFTGANRRREFEEARAIARVERTLFADALDDFDKVLDKFENLVPALALRRSDDDEEPPFRDSRPRLPTPPPLSRGQKVRKFLDQPAVRIPASIALVAGLVAFTAITRGKAARGSEKVILQLLRKQPASFQKLPLKEQFQILFKQAKKEELLNRMAGSKFLTKKGTIVPGQKGAPGMSDKGKLIRNLSKEERGLLKIAQEQQKKDLKFIDFLRKSKLQSPKQLKSDLKRVTDLENQKLIRLRDLGKITEKEFEKKSDEIFKLYKQERVRIDRYELELEGLFDKFQLFKKAPKSNTPKEGSKVMEDFIKNIRKIRKKTNFEPNKTFEKDLSSNFESPGGTDIALAPEGNIFFINQAPGNQINVQEDNSPVTMGGSGNVDPYSTMTKYAEFTASLTA
jgi:uncharacterized membrane protein